MPSTLLRTIVAFLLVSGVAVGQSNVVEEQIRKCDRAFALMSSLEGYNTARAAAQTVREFGVARNDREIEARGLARLAFVELRFGKWARGWDKLMERAMELTEETPTGLARAETLMLDGYLKAMYLDQLRRGTKQIEAASVIGRNLEDDRFLAHVFRYLASAISLSENPASSRQHWFRSVMFAIRAGDEPMELVARQHVLMRQIRDNSQPEENNRRRVLELGRKLLGKDIQVALSDKERLRFQVDTIEELKSELDSEQPDVLKLKRLLAASLLVRGRYFDEEDWPRYKEAVQIAREAAVWLQDKTTQRTLLIDESVLLAKDGQGEAAIQRIRPLDQFCQKTNSTSGLVPAYQTMAVLLQKAGDTESAATCLRSASSHEAKQPNEGWGNAYQSAESFVADVLQTRALRSEVRAKRQQLDRSLFFNSAFSVALPLVGVCVYFWRRSRRHYTIQNQLREQVHDQTISLRLAKEQAEAANRAKTEFVARINHELRNPLASIIGSIELLDDAKEKELSDLKRTIRSCSINLMDTVDEVLDFANIESGRLELYEQDFCPRELVAEVRDIVAPGLSEQTELTIEVGSDVARLVHADVGKVRQVLVNLSENAVRHTPAGLVSIVCKATGENGGIGAGENVNLQFVISDTGTGIPPAQLETLFAEFSGTQLRSGSGLGLYISSSFAARMGGRLTCASDLGRGSQFTFTIPVGVVEAACEIPAVPAALPSSSHLSVLVVDDQQPVGQVVEKILRKLGYESQWVDSWEAAEPFLASGIDIVLLDLRMPEMSGYEFLDRIRETPLPRQPRVFAVTGDATSESKLRVEEAGFDGFLAKPFTVESLQQLIASKTG